MTIAVDPPIDDQEAKEVLSMGYEDLFGPINLFALGFAQAVGLMEGKYGKWGPNNSSNNWGAITRAPLTDGSCPAGSFSHEDSDENGKYQTCFEAYDTSLEGATDLLQNLFVNRPEVFAAAASGEFPEAIRQMYASNYFRGTAPHNQKDPNGEFTNVNRYIAFVQKGIDQIAPLYNPNGVQESSGNALYVALGAAALVGVIAIAKR